MQKKVDGSVMLAGETKEERWKRISSKRYEKVKEYVRRLTKTSRRRYYDYSQDDVDELVNKLEIDFGELKDAFAKGIAKGATSSHDNNE